MWHGEQIDKSDLPYVAHLMGVWNRVREEDEATQLTALLHDIVEDTDITVGQLARFGDEVVEAVALLTHAKDEPYEDYVKRLASNRIASRVKLADLEDNTSPYRTKGLTPEMREWWFDRYKTKYLPAIAFLRRVIYG
jgi:(p)ppGpp synthase/HD superfamily hydrolase